MTASANKPSFTVVLLVAVGLLAAGIGIAHIMSNRPAPARPVAWKPFDLAKLEALLAEGHDVVVFVYPELSPESALVFHQVDAELLESFYLEPQYTAFKLEFDNWSGPDVRALSKYIPSIKDPVILIFRPDREPVAFDPMFLLKQK